MMWHSISSFSQKASSASSSNGESKEQKSNYQPERNWDKNSSRTISHISRIKGRANIAKETHSFFIKHFMVAIAPTPILMVELCEWVQVVPRRGRGGSFRREKTVNERKNLPIECARGDQPARCPNRDFCANEPSAVPWS